MTFYPLVFISKQFKDVLHEEELIPVEPQAPIYPKLSRGILRLFNEKENLIKIEKYDVNYKQYKSKLKIYDEELKIYRLQGKKEYNRYIRLQRIRNCINNSANFFQNKDYRQGYTHSFFKKVLLSRFGNNIYENLSVEKRTYSLIRAYDDNYDNEIDHYVTDFTYIKNNLKIDIEIDEPYSIQTKIPYHLNDFKRNKFFTDRNWAVIRFSESQIIE